MMVRARKFINNIALFYFVGAIDKNDKNKINSFTVIIRKVIITAFHGDNDVWAEVHISLIKMNVQLKLQSKVKEIKKC